MREGVIRFCIVKRGCDTVDSETEKKLTEQQHQIDRLRDKVEASMEIMESRHKEARAESESANERLRTDFEKLRTDFEKLRTTIEGNSKTLIFQTVGVFAAVAGIVGLLIKVFGS